MNVSRSPISCSSPSSDRLCNAPRTMALNINTASQGLRPAADLRSLFGLRQTVSSTGRKSSQGTRSSIIAKCLPRFVSSFRRRPSTATSAKLNCPGPGVRPILRYSRVQEVCCSTHATLPISHFHALLSPLPHPSLNLV